MKDPARVRSSCWMRPSRRPSGANYALSRSGSSNAAATFRQVIFCPSIRSASSMGPTALVTTSACSTCRPRWTRTSYVELAEMADDMQMRHNAKRAAEAVGEVSGQHVRFVAMDLLQATGSPKLAGQLWVGTASSRQGDAVSDGAGRASGGADTSCTSKLTLTPPTLVRSRRPLCSRQREQGFRF